MGEICFKRVANLTLKILLWIFFILKINFVKVFKSWLLFLNYQEKITIAFVLQEDFTDTAKIDSVWWWEL